jgi:hypothetical protein
MSEPKYAVYVVVVEDTEDNDIMLGERTDTFFRVGGMFDWTAAETLADDRGNPVNFDYDKDASRSR